MDSLTQIALGAAVGEAVAGKKAGNKAILWGAVAGTIPDLDVLARHFMSTVDALSFHRGMTHSILFSIVLAPILGYIIHLIHRRSAAGWRDWTLLCFMSLFTHPLLDCFTTWGTQLFWPFSEYRVAFKSIFVIDPLYTIPLLLCLIWLMFLPRISKKRRKLNVIGLSISSLYLVITLFVKGQANDVFEASFENQNIKISRYDSKPSPLNIILWAVTAETEEGYYMGYYSFLDKDNKIKYFYFPKNRHLLEPWLKYNDVTKLINISDGWYTIEQANRGIIYNDLRFGQRTGWETGDGQFVFAYNIYQEDNNVVVKETEKDFGEAGEILSALWMRIRGSQ